MEKYVPEKEHLRHALLFLFNQNKTASESHRMLVETYAGHAPSIKTCETWFRNFKNNNYNLKDDERSGRQKKFEDAELEALLKEDPTQTQQKLAEVLKVSQECISIRLKTMGKIQKMGKWVQNE